MDSICEFRSTTFRKMPYGSLQEGYDFRYGLVESFVEDVMNDGDQELVGAWCYDLPEVRLARDVEAALHAILSDDYRKGELVPQGSLAWERLAWASTMALFGFAQRGFPPCDVYPGPLEGATPAFIDGGFLEGRKRFRFDALDNA